MIYSRPRGIDREIEREEDGRREKWREDGGERECRTHHQGKSDTEPEISNSHLKPDLKIHRERERKNEREIERDEEREEKSERARQKRT